MVAMSSLPVRYCVANLEDVSLVVGVVAVLAALAYSGVTVAHSGSGQDCGWKHVVHFLGDVVGGAIGGHGVGMIGSVLSDIAWVSSASSPRSYRS